MGEYDSNGEWIGSGAPPNRDETAVDAAKREAEGGKKKITVEYDGETWEIPAKPTVGFMRAQASLGSNPTAILEYLLGPRQFLDLGIDDDTDVDDLMEINGEFMDAVGAVWGTGNRSRSSRQSRGTTKRSK